MTKTLALSTILIAALALTACGRRAELKDLKPVASPSSEAPDAVSEAGAPPPRSTVSAGVGESLVDVTVEEEALTSGSTTTPADPASEAPADPAIEAPANPAQ